MEKILNYFERYISYFLLTAGMIFIIFQSLELAWELGRGIFTRIDERGLAYAPDYTKNGVALFFNVLLAMEILETIRVFGKSHETKIRIILIVCLIAISRKILVLDTHEINPMADVGLATLVLAFSIGYYLVSRKGVDKADTKD